MPHCCTEDVAKGHFFVVRQSTLDRQLRGLCQRCHAALLWNKSLWPGYQDCEKPWRSANVGAGCRTCSKWCKQNKPLKDAVYDVRSYINNVALRGVLHRVKQKRHMSDAG